MDETTEEIHVDVDTATENVFLAPSIDVGKILDGSSYTHHSAIPPSIQANADTGCVLGVDEAGRGPVLGPMVYALYYLPLPLHKSLLADTHHFDDSKVLTPQVRSNLMEKICTEGTDLFEHGGWATRVMSARDIASGQLKPNGIYNLNAQAMDATIDLIREVLDKGVNVQEVYIDTIGVPAVYQKKLERIFPSLSITVAKKADSLYPCVSAASVCAKVTRDAALEVLYTAYAQTDTEESPAWGSGYPSDARCTAWMKSNMHPIFGWGSECRFSWGTAKEMLETKGAPCQGSWPEPDTATDHVSLTTFFAAAQEDADDVNGADSELGGWFGRRVTDAVF